MISTLNWLSVVYAFTLISVFYLFQNPDEIAYAFLPSNGAQLVFHSISTIDLTRQNAYKIAEDKVNEDPRHRVCAVSICTDDKYMVRCWEASDAAEMTFESVEGKHQLLYSQIIFKWKDNIPHKYWTSTSVNLAELLSCTFHSLQ